VRQMQMLIAQSFYTMTPQEDWIKDKIMVPQDILFRRTLNEIERLMLQLRYA